jgi:cytochrome c oxidase assembly factor CtaG
MLGLTPTSSGAQAFLPVMWALPTSSSSGAQAFLPVFFTLAHGGKPHDLHDLARTWAVEPYVYLGLALSAWLYIAGLRKMWRDNRGAGVKTWEACCYAGGWLALVVALVSPLHPWGRVLFSAHMTQHEILMLVAAPLLVLGRPILVWLKALPAQWATVLGQWAHTVGWLKFWRAISNPFAAWLIHAAALWMWHVPVLFQATIDNDLVHTLQHSSFLGSALLFWWAVMHGRERASMFGMAVLYMFTTALHSGLLGVLITFADTLVYPAYRNTTQSWGLTPLEDQQLGGLIMWIPAGIVYIIAGLAFMAGWLRESERRVLRAEAQQAAAVAAAAARNLQTV